MDAEKLSRAAVLRLATKHLGDHIVAVPSRAMRVGGATVRRAVTRGGEGRARWSSPTSGSDTPGSQPPTLAAPLRKRLWQLRQARSPIPAHIRWTKTQRPSTPTSEEHVSKSCEATSQRWIVMFIIADEMKFTNPARLPVYQIPIRRRKPRLAFFGQPLAARVNTSYTRFGNAKPC